MLDTFRLDDLDADPIILRGHEIPMNSLAFSPDGKTLAAAGWDNTVLLWDVGDLATKPVALSGHEDEIRAVAFSPDGKTLASGSVDATVRLWDLTNLHAAPVVLSGHGDVVYSVAFSPDGQTLASSSRDGTVRLWMARTNDLAELACQKVRRNLSRTEWAQYLPGEDYRQTCPNLAPGK